jgi:sugar phosphate isomerase/epimerase
MMARQISIFPLGSIPRSSTNWPEHIQKLKASGYDATITLEVFSPEKEHLLLSRDLLRAWWKQDSVDSGA